MSSVLAVSEWATDQEATIRRSVGLEWKRMPCANTYSYVLERLDSQQVNAYLAAWFVRQMAQRPGEERDERHVHLARDSQNAQRHGGASLWGRASAAAPPAYL